MNSEPLQPRRAWQPLTFGGVAAFSRASLGRVLALALGMGGVVSAVVVIVLGETWVPAIEQAISRLPDQGRIRQGRLEWVYPTPALLAESSSLSILIDPEDVVPVSGRSDLQVKFRQRDMELASWFGIISVPYRPGYVLELNHPEVQPAWGAWKPALLALAGGMTFGAVFSSWLLLAGGLAIAVRMLAFFADRDLKFSGAFRLMLAGLMPGAMVMTVALLFYGWHRLNFFGLLVVWPLHLLVALVYAAAAVWALPRVAGAPPLPKNPFAAAAPSPPVPPTGQ